MTGRTKLFLLALSALLGAWLDSPGVLSAQDERQSARLLYRREDVVRCPDEQEFRDIVAGRLGYDPFTRDAENQIAATIERKSRSFVGKVRVHGPDGRELGARDLEASTGDCTEIVTSMAIAISIMLDPLGSAADNHEAAAEPAPLPSPNTPVSQAQEPVAAAPQKPERDVSMVARASLAVDGGLAPGVTLGPLVSLGVSIDRLSVLLDARVDLMPGVATTEDGDRLEATLFTAGPSGCFAFGVGLACAGLEFGAFQGRGVDVTNPRTQTSFFSSADARAGIALPLGKVLSLTALGEIRAALVRTSLSIEGRTVWNAPPLGYGFSLGLGATFL